ncbi:kinase-like protein, partial [Amniculicola lignicola CBS 123094]
MSSNRPQKGYKAVSVSIPHVESFSLHTSDYASTTDSSTSSQFDAGEPIQINEGDDIIVNHSSELPYRLIENLGHGYSATVEKVEDTWTGCVYARKVFRIHGGHNKRRQVYENEVRIIRRLDPHHHVIQVFATYMAKRELGLMLTPVADSGDLGTFLEDFLDEMPRDSRKIRIINMAFGCLSSGLAFLHKQKGRHKDIKPGNILIHQETVVYTDFGYSFDYSSQNQSTTDGRPDSFTRKYCAPEVEDWAPRNSKSDIYSLGCVFLEMYASL